MKLARKTKAMLEQELLELKQEEKMKDMTVDELYWFIKAEEYNLKDLARVYGDDELEEEFKKLKRLREQYEYVVHVKKRKEIYQSNTWLKKLDLL